MLETCRKTGTYAYTPCTCTKAGAEAKVCEGWAKCMELPST